MENRYLPKVIDDILREIPYVDAGHQSSIQIVYCKLQDIKQVCTYKAPEQIIACWDQVANILNSYLDPKRNNWEMKVLKIFNDESESSHTWPGDEEILKRK